MMQIYDYHLEEPKFDNFNLIGLGLKSLPFLNFGYPRPLKKA